VKARREDIRAGIDTTLRCIERRARLYRRLVMLVSAILLATVAVAIFARAQYAIFALPLLFLCLGAYIVLDHAEVATWVRSITLLRRERRVDLRSLSEALRLNPTVPMVTVQGMLASVPASPDADYHVSYVRTIVGAGALALLSAIFGAWFVGMRL
jgi:hypothetical protein